MISEQPAWRNSSFSAPMKIRTPLGLARQVEQPQQGFLSLQRRKQPPYPLQIVNGGHVFKKPGLAPDN